MLWHANEKMKSDLFFIRNEAYRLRNLAHLYEKRGMPPRGRAEPPGEGEKESSHKTGGKGN